jgi:glycogen operon protein
VSPNWADHSHSLAVALEVEEGLVFHVMLSSYWEPLEFEQPPAGEARGPWHRLIDTSLESLTTSAPGPGAPDSGETYRLQPYSVAILFAYGKEEG